MTNVDALTLVAVGCIDWNRSNLWRQAVNKLNRTKTSQSPSIHSGAGSLSAQTRTQSAARRAGSYIKRSVCHLLGFDAAQPRHSGFATHLDWVVHWVLLGSFPHETLFPMVLATQVAQIQAIFPRDPAFLLAVAAMVATVTDSAIVAPGFDTLCAVRQC